jgi:hypothetical protein
MLHAGASAVCSGTPAKTRREEGARVAPAQVISRDFKQPSPFPRRVFCARVFASLLRATSMKGWRSAESRTGPRRPVGLHVTRQARRLARRLASLGDARLSALAPWRFWAPGPRFPSPALRPDRSQRTPRIRVVVSGGGAPASRGDGYEPPPRDATPRSVLRIVSRARPFK